MIFKFNLGQEVKDIVTEFQGVVIARTQYLNKCIRYGIQPTKLKDGKPLDWEYIDEEQLEETSSGIDDKIKNIFKKSKSSGGDRRDCPQR